MRAHRFIFVLLLATLVLNSALPPAQGRSVSVGVAGESPQQPLVECYNGAVPPEGALCLVVPLAREDGGRVDGIEVKATLRGRSLRVRSEQLITEPIGTAAAALPVSEIGARPADLLGLSITFNGRIINRQVSFDPDPSTRIHRIKSWPLDRQEPAPATIWGTVTLLDGSAPLSNQEVELYSGDTLLASSRTQLGSHYTQPHYSFNPAGLQNEQLLRLETTYGKQHYEAEFTWKSQPVEVPLILGWPCDGTIPRGGDNTTLPPDFCLVVNAYDGDVAVEDAAIYVSVGNSEYGPYPTKRPLKSQLPGVAFELGRAMQEAGEEANVRLIALHDRKVGIYTATVADFELGKRWTKQIHLELEASVRAGFRLAGGTPGPVAAFGQIIYQGSAGGLAVRRGGGTSWLRVVGSGDQALPAPEITALLGVGNSASHEYLVAGLSSGAVVFSEDSGETWTELLAPVGRPVQGLALTQRALAIVRGRERWSIPWRDQRVSQPGNPAPVFLIGQRQMVETMAFAPTALGVLTDDRLVAGASDGVYLYELGTWRRLLELEVTALTTVWPADRAPLPGSELLLVGTPAGLWLTDIMGVNWSLVLPQQVRGVTEMFQGNHRSSEVYVTTSAGMFSGKILSASAQPEFLQQTFADGEQDRTKQTVGMPDVQDLAVAPDQTMIAAGSSGVYVSGDQGLNWDALPPLGDGLPVRSVARLPQGDLLALTAEHLWRLPPQASAWQPVSGLPEDLNGVVVRVAGSRWLIGRAAGPGDSLMVSSDNGQSWSFRQIGESRGVTAIAPTLDASQGMHAVIATDGDGAYVWFPDTSQEVQRLPDLLDGAGRVARISSLMVDGGACRLIVGTFGSDAGVAARPCDTTSAWGALQSLPLGGQNVGAVTALAKLGEGRYLAGSAAGFLQGAPDQEWVPAPFSPALRPATLLVPQNYPEMRRFLAGGPQSGVLLFTDLAPDLAVSLRAPREMKGGIGETAVITFTNQGLLPTEPTTYQLSPVDTQQALSSSILEGNVPELGAGQVFTAELGLKVHKDVRPERARLIVSSPLQEQFLVNNSAAADIELRYRDGADPRPLVSVRSTMKLGDQGRLRLQVRNSGNQTSSPSTVTALLPPVISASKPEGATLTGQELNWSVPVLPASETVSLDVPFTLTGNPTSDTRITIPVTLSTTDNDREPNNNTVRARLLVQPSKPLGLIVTNFTRLNTQSLLSIDALSDQIAEVAQHEHMLLLDLGDDGSLCNTSAAQPTALSCLYQTWDASSAKLAEAVRATQPDEDLIDQWAEEAIVARAALVKAIQARIEKEASALATPINGEPLYLYLVGGDAVIPADTRVDVTAQEATLNQGATPERRATEQVRLEESLYAVFRSNHYPHYASYRRIGAMNFSVGVQAGAPSDLLSALQTFLATDGVLQLRAENVNGIAHNLTVDTQRWICQELQRSQFAVHNINCASVEPKASAGLERMVEGATMTVLSGHATNTMIGDLSSSTIVTATMSTLNLILLLGCHSGLTPDQVLADKPALMAALARKGQPALGFTGYAYALYDTATLDEESAYAEQMARLVVRKMQKDALHSLGGVVQHAIAAYEQDRFATDPAKLHQKTVDTFTLYGPPMYQLDRPTPVTGAPTPPSPTDPAAMAAPVPPAERVAVAAIFAAQQEPFGTSYRATVDRGESFPLIEMSRSKQPALSLTLPLGVTSVVLSGGSYHDLPGVDPVIPRILPLQGAQVYTEPPPMFSGFDWREPPQVRPDGDGIPRLLLPLGMWNKDTAVQRLIDRVTLTLVRPTDPNAGPPALADQPTLCLLGHEVSITVDEGANIERVEVVVLNNGVFETHPLRLTGKTWRAKVAIPEGRELYLQVIGKNGTVIYLNNNGDNYTAPGKVTPCRPN